MGVITGSVGYGKDSVHSHSEEISVFSLKIGVPGIFTSFKSAEISDEAIMLAYMHGGLCGFTQL